MWMLTESLLKFSEELRSWERGKIQGKERLGGGEPSISFVTVSLIALEFTNYASWVGQGALGNLPVSGSPVPGSQVHATTFRIFI